MKEATDVPVWKEKIRIIHHSLKEKIRRIWNTMVGGWALDLHSVNDPDSSGLLHDLREVTHNERPCYLMSTGEMNDGELMRNHISRKIIDSKIYKVLKQSP